MLTMYIGRVPPMRSRRSDQRNAFLLADKQCTRYDKILNCYYEILGDYFDDCAVGLCHLWRRRQVHRHVYAGVCVGVCAEDESGVEFGEYA